MVLGREKRTPVEFLAPFVEVTFTGTGTAKMELPEGAVKPVAYGLVVPLTTNGVPLYKETIGAELAWESKGTRLTIAPSAWADYKAVGGSMTALVSIPRIYLARKMSALLPAEVRKMSNSSAEVMALINAKDPSMVDRITKLVSGKVKGGGDSNISTEIESALNVELALRHPDLMFEIERLQLSQSAIQLAVVLDAPQDFFVTLNMSISGGADMISGLLRDIDPLAQSEDAPISEKDAEKEVVDVQVERLIPVEESNAWDDDDDFDDDFDDDDDDGDDDDFEEEEDDDDGDDE
jgi:hypothetical protein